MEWDRKNPRFVVTYEVTAMARGQRILVDKETGVNYLHYSFSGEFGVVVLVDKDGKPLVTEVDKL